MTDPIPQTDVSRPSALPTASLLLPKSISSQRLQQSQEQNSTQYLDDIEEEWNKKVDVEVETLVDGMVDIVSLASVCVILILSHNNALDLGTKFGRLAIRISLG